MNGFFKGMDILMGAGVLDADAVKYCLAMVKRRDFSRPDKAPIEKAALQMFCS